MKKHAQMKSMKLISYCLLFTVLIGATAFNHAVVADPFLEVVPTQHDFGEVEIGSSSYTIITIANINGHDLIIYSIVFGAGSSSDFSIVSDLVFPMLVNSGSYFDVEITFTPTSEGVSSAILEIESNDPGKPIVDVELVGVGVAYEPSPSEKIEDILAFFDEAVQEGTLEGRGSGWIARARSAHQRSSDHQKPPTYTYRKLVVQLSS